MSEQPYRTAPAPIATMPPGVPFIIANEAAERFSFYGMKAILTVFMTKHLVDASGSLAVMAESDAKGWYHLFVTAVYAFPILGALLADTVLGKYRTILWLSLVYCAGHLALALDETRLGLALGLGLIAIGSGGIKPCVSAHVGDQFGSTNSHLVERVFQWFYFAINLGSAAATMLTPVLLDRWGPHVAFGVPGVLMAVATVLFWMGRRVFVHIPPGGTAFVREVFSRDGLGSLGKMLVVFAFVAMFWAIFDQTGSAWVLQAEHMDRELFGLTLDPSQLQAANPLIVMALIPFSAWVTYPLIGRVFPLTPLRKIGLGLFVTVGAALVTVWIQARIDAGETPSVAWQLLAYLILTQAEVMISITALELSYTQAPRRMKSFVMAIYLLSVAVGNAFVAAVSFLAEGLDGAAWFAFFAGAMFVSAVLFVPVARWFPERTILQDERR